MWLKVLVSKPDMFQIVCFFLPKVTHTRITDTHYPFFHSLSGLAVDEAQMCGSAGMETWLFEGRGFEGNGNPTLIFCLENPGWTEEPGRL